MIGGGEVAGRALPGLQRRHRVTALVRSPDPALDAAGVEQITGDLDDAASLAPLAGRAGSIVHLAPPTGNGALDTRMRNLLAALGPRGRGAMLPRRFVYLSSSGVYGDCAGEWIDEMRPPRPQTGRALRRFGRMRTSTPITSTPTISPGSSSPRSNRRSRAGPTTQAMTAP